MILFKRKINTMAARCTACLVAAGLLLSFLPATPSRAEEKTEEKGVVQTTHNGFTYSYRELEGYQGSVEIVGVTVPAGEMTLTIPETLDGRTVVSLDFGEYGSISPEQVSAATESPVKKTGSSGDSNAAERYFGGHKTDEIV